MHIYPSRFWRPIDVMRYIRGSTDCQKSQHKQGPILCDIWTQCTDADSEVYSYIITLYPRIRLKTGNNPWGIIHSAFWIVFVAIISRGQLSDNGKPLKRAYVCIYEPVRPNTDGPSIHIHAHTFRSFFPTDRWDSSQAPSL